MSNKQVISQDAKTILDKMVVYKVFKEDARGFDFTDEFRKFSAKFVDENLVAIKLSENIVDKWMLVLDDFGVKDISDRRNFAKILAVRKIIIDEQGGK